MSERGLHRIEVLTEVLAAGTTAWAATVSNRLIMSRRSAGRIERVSSTTNRDALPICQSEVWRGAHHRWITVLERRTRQHETLVLGQGLARLLDLPGYDVAALFEKSGKSASNIYARLSLLQLIPEVAEAFTQERVMASHANLIPPLPQEYQGAALEQCWRNDWSYKEPYLLPAKHVAAWIQANLYPSLAERAL